MLALNPYYSTIDELFARTDDGCGGRWQTARRRWKLRLRSWLHAGALKGTVAAFQDSQLQRLPHSEPSLLLRPLRSYLRQGLSAPQRVQALRSHFAWLAETLAASVIEQLYGGRGLTLSEGLPGDAPDMASLRITLTSATGWGREGELALHLEHGGRRLMTLAFSVVRRCVAFGGTSNSVVLLLGAIQGARGADAALRALSHGAERLRPHALLITAVQGLAWGLGVNGLYGVATGAHVYAGYRSSARHVGIDYDAIWSEVGGTPAGRHYWALPAHPVLRPEQDVPSKRRSQHRRRNALRKALFSQCEAAARHLRLGQANSG